MRDETVAALVALLEGLAEAIRREGQDWPGDPATAVPASAPVETVPAAPEAAVEPAPAAPVAETVAPVIDLAAIRALATEKAKAGQSGQVKDALAKVGAAKLTEVPQDKYGELWEVLNGA